MALPGNNHVPRERRNKAERTRSMEMGYQENQLPADLSAPPAVLRWRFRAVSIAVVFAVLAVIDALLSHNFDYVLRGWLMGLMICLGFCLGGLAGPYRASK